MKKYYRNFKLSMEVLIATLFISIVLFLIFICCNIWDLGLICLSIITVLFLLIISLFLPPFGLLYFVSFDNEGIKLYFCKKLIKQYKWSDIYEIKICNPFRSGNYFEVFIKNKDTFNSESFYISESKAVEQEIEKYFTITK